MLLLKDVYCKDGSFPYEVETSYYLGFYVKSVLFSIELISKPHLQDDIINIAQYYHYYTDHLLFSMGQIYERFSDKKKNERYKERCNANRMNYDFKEETFPLLSNKIFRNIMEHIDEYNYDVTNENGGVGGFNYIDSNTSLALADSLRKDRKKHIYTLDLVEGFIYLTGKNQEEHSLRIEDIKNEAIRLECNINSFVSFIKTP